MSEDTVTIELEGTVQRERSKTYLMVPFEMPANVIRLDVAYEYSDAIGSDPHLTGGNTVDIGIFDARGDMGFRGWSGSARSTFFITATEATPGYMSGPLQVGRWQVCLGLYKIADEGCNYRVSITLTFGEPLAEMSFPSRLELNEGPRPDRATPSGWYRGELHCHTYHSDGDSSVEAVVRQAETLGLDFLSITDHNVLSQRVALKDIETPLMLIPGTEVTTFRGHWNTWGNGDWIDFRMISEEDMQRAVNSALRAGYLISCNHPRPYGPEWEYPDVSGFHCIEVWNGPWRLFNNIALAYWEEKLRAGEKYTAIGGSDCHFLKREHHARLGHPTTYVYIEGDPSPKAVLDAIRAGHVFLTESSTGPQLYLETQDAIMGDTIATDADHFLFKIKAQDAVDMKLEIWGANGILRESTVTETEWETSFELDIQNTSFVRAQLVSGTNDERQVHALTNPIYIHSTR